jgi:hypothetical protein
MYIPFCVRFANQAQCARGLRPPIAQPRVRLAVIVCLGILFTPLRTSPPPAPQVGFMLQVQGQQLTGEQLTVSCTGSALPVSWICSVSSSSCYSGLQT